MLTYLGIENMKKLLIAAILLFSTIAFASTETTLAIEGLIVKEEQVITVELRNSEDIYIHMFRSPVALEAKDQMEIKLQDVAPGEYEMTVTVRENDVRKQKKGEYAIGNLVAMHVAKVIIK